MTDAKKDEVAQLRKELADLKAKVTPEPYDPAAAAKWASDLHALREARMAHASAFSRADLEAMEAAAPTSVVKDIALRDARAPQGPSSQGAIPSSQQVSNIHTGGPSRSGWAREIPLGPPPGVGYVDMLCEVDAAKQRGEAMIQEAKRKVAEKE